jgi:glycosyltransferase involved in cell wall biosynthesis
MASSPSAPRVSIVTAVLNRRAFIAEAIESVLGQTYPHIEHIVIDGGSTDGTLEVLRKYADRIVRWESRPDRGMYHAINRGLELMTGDLWGCLNSDDYYADPEAIRRVVDAYREFGPRAAIFFGDYAVATASGLERKNLLPVDHSRLLAFRHGTLLPHPATFLTREVARRLGGFDTRYRFCADYDYLLRATREFRTHHIASCLTVMRRHADSFSIAMPSAMRTERRRIVAEHESSLSLAGRARLRIMRPALLVKYGVKNLATVRRRLAEAWAWKNPSTST